ncbi:MAG: homoserine dehydrogenase [Elusimicrobiota bacterium]
MDKRPRRGRPLGVAIAGLGNVGRETARLLTANRAKFSARLGGDLRLAWVCERRASARRMGLPGSVRRATDFAPLLRDPAVDIVIELFGGVRHARRLVLDALAAGKHVVTANKHLLSQCWNEVCAASRRHERSVYFEAAVAGGIPIVQAIRFGLAANRIDTVYGIFNGTTNHILSQMAHEGCEMADALREAQRLGMAEADPTLDLNGTDTAHKISIVASMLTGNWLPPDRIPRQGIERIEAEDIGFAVRSLGRTVRLIGTIAPRWDARPVSVEAHVQPTLVPLKHPLAAVHGGYNAVIVQASAADDLMFYGKGAGPGPAASAVLADLLALGGEILGGGAPTYPSGPQEGGNARHRIASPVEESEAPYYLKLRVRDVPGALSRITGILGRAGISIARIHQDARAAGRGRAVPVMILTHAARRALIDRARRAITALPMVDRAHSCLRLLPDS